MSTDTTLQMQTSDSENTLKLGEQLGANCHGGEVFVLSSDLGGGKTTITKGIATGMESKDKVTSPTFTVCNVYEAAKGKELHHFDFYRLSEAGIMSNEINEVAGDPNVVVVVEWGDIVDDVLPKDAITIEIKRTKAGEDFRDIIIKVPAEHSYITEGIK